MSALPQAARAARHYTDRLGWTLVAIPSGQKGPRTPGWQNCGIADPTAAVRTWTRIPDHGMGLVHGPSGTVAIDADMSGEHVARALAAAGIDYAALLDAGTPAIIGNPAKPPKLVYRLLPGIELRRRVLHWPDPDAPGDRARRVVVLEMRAGAVQDVLPPSIHPGTGEPYRWTVPPRTPDDVPYLPAALARLWLGWRKYRPRMEAACPWAPPVPVEVPRRPAHTRPYDGPSIIERYCAETDVTELLARHGYRPARDGRWVAPSSTTGTPGVVVLEGSRVYSHHGSDPLGDGDAHDAFDVLAILEYGGDRRAAARALRERTA